MKRSRFVKGFLTSFLTGIGAAAISACSRQSEPEGDAPAAGEPGANAATAAEEAAEIAVTGPWKVALAAGFPPFVKVQAEGRLEGFDVDLITAIGAALGVTLQLELLPFDSLLPTLQAGRAEVALGAIPITPERAESVNFSQPYFDAGVAIAIATSRTDIADLQDLQDQQVAVVLDTAGAQLALDISGSTLQTFETDRQALEAVSTRKADAALVTLPAVLDAIAAEQISGIKRVGDRLTREQYGIAVPKSSDDRLAAINLTLERLKSNGTYADLYEKWFGPSSLAQ